MIKFRRYFNAALRLLMNKKERMRLKERGRYIVINPDITVQEHKKGSEDSNEYTDGFYTSESDDFVPHETVQLQQQS